MNEEIRGIALLIVVLWPLLLALPAIHSRLPWPRYLALVPAILMIGLPGDSFLAMPWSFFGIGFGVDGKVRWILGMSIAIWLTAATAAESSRCNPTYNPAITLFLITLSGNLGAILATDLVGFFSFSTLMGYGFYGLFIQDGDEEVRRAGGFYLLLLIVADLVLFEGMLLAANTAKNLQYHSVRQAMIETSSSQFYLWMVFLGFAIKAGIWPFHLWLMAAFSLRHRMHTLLLAGVPVAIGLLGMVRWFPLGENTIGYSGIILQMLGMAALLYAALKLFALNSVRILPAFSTIAVTGCFVFILGWGLAQPPIWSKYEYIAYPFIAILGIFLTALTFAIDRRQVKFQPPTSDFQRVETFIILVRKWGDAIQEWIKHKSLGLQSFLCTSELNADGILQQILDWEKSAVFKGRWSVIIPFFVLLGLVISWFSN